MPPARGAPDAELDAILAHLIPGAPEVPPQAADPFGGPAAAAGGLEEGFAALLEDNHYLAAQQKLGISGTRDAHEAAWLLRILDLPPGDRVALVRLIKIRIASLRAMSRGETAQVIAEFETSALFGEDPLVKTLRAARKTVSVSVTPRPEPYRRPPGVLPGAPTGASIGAYQRAASAAAAGPALNRSVSTACYTCGARGHKALDCPTKK
jgi:hypothetical protein